MTFPPASPTGLRVVLASASPRRADILRQLGLHPETHPADVDETVRPGENPTAHVVRLSLDKAGAVAVEHPDAVVVAGDTVVVADGRILGKPESDEDAVRMLLALSGRVHQVHSGVAVVAPGGRRTAGSERTSVRMRAFDEAEARAYVATGEPMDKAGAYGIQGAGAALVDGLEGDYYAVVGLPVVRLLDLLEQVGVRYTFTGLETGDPPA